MMTPTVYRLSKLPIVVRVWLARIALLGCVSTCLCGHTRGAWAAGMTYGLGEPLRVAVYNVAPYGSVDAEGLYSGISVDLWRRVAEDQGLTYHLEAVDQIDAVLSGLENGMFDAAIGAITITPERLAHVDFSYPAHRSGVAVAFTNRTGPAAAIGYYVQAIRQHVSLIAVTVVLLGLTGTLVWGFERRRRAADEMPDSAVASLFDGLYWAVVTMTTVGYGDKTPKTAGGRFIAVIWMLTSLALVSLVSTTLVSSMTAARLETGPLAHNSDLFGKRLAAVTSSSGAEYLDSQHLAYAKFANLRDALISLSTGKSDAVVNSVGALEYIISTEFYGVIAMPGGLLAPAYMAFALPPGSPLKKQLDRALIRITSSPSWRSVEDSYFSR
jgi:polar amino acid transport system substrate-binding protein